jgi:DNA-binding IclR family transcriptional regulator
MSTDQLKTVTKAMDVLIKIAFSNTMWGPREIARELDIDKSSAQRILNTYRAKKILSYDASVGKYSCGPELIRLSIALTRQHVYSHTAKPIIKKYVSVLNENIYLFSYHDGENMIELNSVAENELHPHLKTGLFMEIYFGCSGKVSLANISEDEAEEHFRYFAEHQLCNVPLLRKQTQDCKEKGYAFSIGERETGMVGFSAPVFGAGNQFKGGITMGMPEVRYKSKDHGKYRKAIISCASEITEALGQKV